MVYGLVTHPQLLRAFAAAGHGSKILLTDADYPHTTGVSSRCEPVSLNPAPGMLDVIQILEVLKQVRPIEKAEIMVPVPDTPQVQIPIHEEFKAQPSNTRFAELSRFDFYDAAHGGDVGIIVATGEQHLYSSLLLTVRARAPGQ